MLAVGLLCAPGLSCNEGTDPEECIPKFHLFSAEGQTWKRSHLFKHNSSAVGWGQPVSFSQEL